MKANKAQWKIKKKEFASLTAKEKNTKRLSMKEAADVAKKRLKLQEDDDDSDDDGSDDGKLNEPPFPHWFCCPSPSASSV